MKPKNILTVVLLMCFYLGNAQITSPFTSLKNAIKPTVFKPVGLEPAKMISMEMLSKIGFSETVNQIYEDKVLPSKFNWVCDAFRIESYKRMILDSNKQDVCGRDLPRDIHQDLMNQMYVKESKFFY